MPHCHPNRFKVGPESMVGGVEDFEKDNWTRDINISPFPRHEDVKRFDRGKDDTRCCQASWPLGKSDDVFLQHSHNNGNA